MAGNTLFLGFFGISIPVVQVGGGLIVISNGWALLKSKEEVDRAKHWISKGAKPSDTVASFIRRAGKVVVA